MTSTPVANRAAWGRRFAFVTLGIAFIALAARVSWTIPGTTVPQSGQTLAVVLVGAWAGLSGGVTTLTAYLVVGGLGLPVFADGASGWSHLVGPTAGYLVGFVLAAAVVGWAADRDLLRSFGRMTGVMMAAHVVILALGWLRLASSVGMEPAFQGGVSPFLLGGVVKSVVGAGVIFVASRTPWPRLPTRAGL